MAYHVVVVVDFYVAYAWYAVVDGLPIRCIRPRCIQYAVSVRADFQIVRSAFRRAGRENPQAFAETEGLDFSRCLCGRNKIETDTLSERVNCRGEQGKQFFLGLVKFFHC